MTELLSEFLLLLKGLPRDWRAVIDRRLAPLGLSQAKWQPVLVVLRAPCPPTQAEIARQLDIESPTLVRLLDRLEADGWIERKSCSGDRRARRIHLSEQGKALGPQIEAIVLEVREQLMRDVGVAELRHAMALLGRIHGNAQRLLEAEPEPAIPVPAAANPPPARRSRKR